MHDNSEAHSTSDEKIKKRTKIKVCLNIMLGLMEIAWSDFCSFIDFAVVINNKEKLVLF